MPVSSNYRTKLGRDFAAALREEEEREAQRCQLVREMFIAGFKRSYKGNLWRRWCDMSGHEVTLTIFRADCGNYRICMADHNGPHYPPTEFATEQAALEELAAIVVPAYPLLEEGPPPCR